MNDSSGNSYMSGPKADAILARSGDPTMKKKRKKLKKEDYIGGSSGRGEGTNGLVFHTEDDEWQRRRRDEVEADGEDAPRKSCPSDMLRANCMPDLSAWEGTSDLARNEISVVNSVRYLPPPPIRSTFRSLHAGRYEGRARRCSAGAAHQT